MEKMLKKNSESYVNHMSDGVKQTLDTKLSQLSQKSEKNIFKKVEELDAAISVKISDGIKSDVANLFGGIKKLHTKICEVEKSMNSEFVRISDFGHANYTAIISEKFERFAEAFSDIMKAESEMLRLLKGDFRDDMQKVPNTKQPVSEGGHADSSE